MLDDQLFEHQDNPEGNHCEYKDFNDLDSPMMKAIKGYKSK